MDAGIRHADLHAETSHLCLDGVRKNARSFQSQAASCQALIDYIANEVLRLDLSHIQGAHVAAGDIVAITNLLEVMHELMEILEETDGKLSDRLLLPRDFLNFCAGLSSKFVFLSGYFPHPSKAPCRPRICSDMLQTRMKVAEC